MAFEESLSGGLSGGSIGWMIGGPVGGFIGGAAGSMFGKSARKKRRRAEEKMRTENTKMAYGMAEGEYARLSESRAGIQERYERSLASERARMASTGMMLSGSGWEEAQGRVARERDEALSEVATEQQEFEQSDAYKWLQTDVEYATRTKDPYSKMSGTLTPSFVGRGGDKLLTDEQMKNVQKFTSDMYEDRWYSQKAKAYEEYVGMLKPESGEYIKSRFGTDEDKAAYEQSMTKRIEQANKFYNAELAKIQLTAKEMRDRNRMDD